VRFKNHSFFDEKISDLNRTDLNRPTLERSGLFSFHQAGYCDGWLCISDVIPFSKYC